MQLRDWEVEGIIDLLRDYETSLEEHRSYEEDEGRERIDNAVEQIGLFIDRLRCTGTIEDGRIVHNGDTCPVHESKDAT